MHQIIGNKKEMRLNWVPKILRIQMLSQSEYEFMFQIKKASRQCCLAFVTIYDQFRERRRAREIDGASVELRQFVVPFDTDINIYCDIYKFVQEKLVQLKSNPDNNLENMDVESLKLWTQQYNNKINTARGCQIIWNKFDWKNPILQFHITKEHMHNQINDLLEQRTTLQQENELYQPYSSTPNQTGLYHFVYLAAQLDFAEDSKQAAQRRAEASVNRGIAINGKNSNGIAIN